MNSKLFSVLLLALAVAGVFAGPPNQNKGGNGQCKRKDLSFSVRMIGTISGVSIPTPYVTGDVPRIPYIILGPDTTSTCFSTKMLLMGSNKEVGQISDCLQHLAFGETNMTAFNGNPIETGMYVNNRAGFVIFDFGSGNKGFFASFNEIIPTTPGGHEVGSSSLVTHAAVSIPDAGADHRMGASTGLFENVSGTSRLAGAVNLNQVGSGIIYFDCIFQVELHSETSFPKYFVVDTLGQQC